MKHFKFILPLIFILFSCTTDSVQVLENTQLELTIKDENNIPVENSEVKLYASQDDCDNGTNVVQTLTTDTNGKVLFQNLQSIKYFWTATKQCYVNTADNSVNPITNNSLNVFSTSLTINFTGRIMILNNSAYNCVVTYTGPENGTLTLNANSSYTLELLDIGDYEVISEPIGEPTPTIFSNSLTVNCSEISYVEIPVF